MSDTSPPPPQRQRLRRAARWALRGIGGVVAFYALFLLVGFWPVNRGFVEAEEGVAIYVWSGSVHTDLYVPIRNSTWDWSGFFPSEDFKVGETDWASYYAIGWGDRGFYLETPTWSDMKASTAINAMLLPSSTVAHVACYGQPAIDDSTRRVVISAEDYQALCESIEASLVLDRAGRPRRIPNEAYHEYDAFYEARGAYHCFYTCNSWAGDRLKEAGVCVPLWSPLPGTASWWFP